MKIGFIGTGNMSEALISGCKEKFEHIYVSNKTVKKAQDIAKKYNVNLCQSNIDVAKECDIIILGVKPNIYAEVLKEIYDFTKDKLIISIAAGLTLEYLYSLTKNDCIFVRSMPNTPALAMAGMTGISFDDKINDKQKQTVLEFFKSVGEILVVDESKMDLVVAGSGSSPAYVFMFIDAIAKACNELGLNYDEARFLATNALLGSAKLVLEQKDTSLEQLVKNVCSPKGVTIEGVAVLENKLDKLMKETVQSVVNRSIEITK